MKGSINVVGIGFPSLISELALDAINNADVVVGYTKYIDEISYLIKPEQELFHTGMRKEIDRIEYAVGQAILGRKVCVVCSGDPTLYGMASLTYELSEGKGIDIYIVPSVTAAMAVSSRLGAVITDDLVMLSLSDQLTPWKVIQKRVDAVNLGDFVCAIYNPKSKSRVTQLPYTLDKFFQERGDLLVGVVTNAFRSGEIVTIERISTLDIEIVNMFSLVLVGNSRTKLIDGKMVTPRGYIEKYKNIDERQT